ncbi:MAG: endonuclease III [Armatimonadota bacterium]|nr:endonuclease III [Armatimonadota bacterium]
MEDKRRRVQEILEILKRTHPKPEVMLNFTTPFELLVATILAAQSTDVKVNEVTARLFKKYRSPEDFANADPKELEADIHETGFFRQKAKSIIEASKEIVSRYGGKVPDTIEELTKLPGVGRKTANVILARAYGKPAIIVDTHVLRVSARLGLVDPILAEKKEADKVEMALREIVPEEDWVAFSDAIVALGRTICTARSPKHSICPILHLCPTGQAEIKAKKDCK